MTSTLVHVGFGNMIVAERIEPYKLLDDLGVVVDGHLLLAARVLENEGLDAWQVGEHFGNGDASRLEEARVSGIEAVLVAVAVVVEYDYALVAAEKHAFASPCTDKLDAGVRLGARRLERGLYLGDVGKGVVVAVAVEVDVARYRACVRPQHLAALQGLHELAVHHRVLVGRHDGGKALGLYELQYLRL